MCADFSGFEHCRKHLGQCKYTTQQVIFFSILLRKCYILYSFSEGINVIYLISFTELNQLCYKIKIKAS